MSCRVFLLVVLLLFSACSGELEQTGDGKKQVKSKLTVGMELAYPPFEMTDVRGVPTGVSVDIAHALGDYLGLEIDIQNIAFDGLIPALKTGKIDLIISSMTATEERSQSIDFSDPYLITGLCLLVNKDSGIHSVDDLSRDEISRIAVKKGTTGHSYAVDRYLPEKLLVLDKESSAVLEVVQNKAVAFIYDQMSTFKNWQRHQDTTRALLDPFQKEAWAVGIRKGNTELKKQVNAFLASFREKGGFEKLGNKYLSEQKAAFQKMNYPFYF